MKKQRVAWIGFIVLITGFILFTYVFITGSRIPVSHTAHVNVPVNRATDLFTQQGLTANWFPGTKKDSCFEVNGYCFRFFENLPGMVVALIYKNKIPDTGFVYISKAGDSCMVSCTVSLRAGISPFTRIGAYFAAQSLKKAIRMMIDSFAAYTANDKRLYGMVPVIEKVTDTLSLSQKKIFNHYPTPAEVYALTSELEKYIAANGALVTRSPMLHVLQTDSAQFETMVAVPINKPVSNNGNFILKRMPPGKIIAATINGGMYTIQQGLLQLEQYKRDHQLTSPAIAYQSMTTNRINEPDTNKWVTTLYYPVF
jgi:hypothetical protein